MRNGLFGILVFSFSFLNTACDQAESDNVTPERSAPYLALKQYSPVTYYIAYREFVNLHPELTKDRTGFEEQALPYIEQRMFEMEPEKSPQPGMLKDLVDRQKDGIAAVKLKMGMSGLSKTQIGNDPASDFPKFFATIEEELAFLKPGDAEKADILAVEALAKERSGLGKSFSPAAYQGKVMALRARLETSWMNDEDTWTVVTTPIDVSYVNDYALLSSAFVSTVLTGLGYTVSYIGWVALRAGLASHYAISEHKLKYPNSTPGDKGDAFRHVYWNVLLQRWLASFWAKYLTDKYEELHPNEARHAAMDLHNNRVGHETQYDALRGHILWDLIDWREMSANTKAFIENSSNGYYMEAWRDGNEPSHPSTLEKAKETVASVDEKRYIFINE